MSIGISEVEARMLKLIMQNLERQAKDLVLMKRKEAEFWILLFTFTV